MGTSCAISVFVMANLLGLLGTSCILATSSETSSKSFDKLSKYLSSRKSVVG